MSQYTRLLTLLLVLGCSEAFAQTLPTTQPNLLQIIREEVKLGHGADHTKTEAGWPAAFEKAKSPYFYLALTSMTGTNEVWYVIPYESRRDGRRDEAVEPRPGSGCRTREALEGRRGASDGDENHPGHGAEGLEPRHVSGHREAAVL